MSARPDNSAEVRRVTWIGLAANLLLAAMKLAGGFWGGSRAVVADAVHSLSDGITDVAILVGVRFWSAPPDEKHPHGHGRIETLVTSGIGLMLAAVGVGIVWDAVAGLGRPREAPPGVVALVVTLISIVTKEGLYRWTAAAGRRVHSQALLANAWHHRSDVLSSLPAFVAVAVAMAVPHWSFVDLVGAVVVAVFILQAAWHILKPAVGDLVDTAAPRETRDRIEALVLEVSGVRCVHDIRTRSVGDGVAVDMAVHVDPDISVRAGHDIALAVKRRLLDQGPEIIDVMVHIDPDVDPHEASRPAIEEEIT